MATFSSAARRRARSALVLALLLVASGILLSVGTASANSNLAPTRSVANLRPESTLTPGPATILPGQSSLVTATVPSSGTGPYSWQWLYSTNGGESYEAATSQQCGTPSGREANAGATEACDFTDSGATPPGTYYFELRVTDSATVPESAISPAVSAVTVEAGRGSSEASSGVAPQFATDPQEDCTGGCDTTNWFAGTHGSGALVITTTAADELLLLEITDSFQTGADLSTADISDSQGSTWTLEPAEEWDGFGHTQYIYYAIDATVGSDTVTLDSAAGTHTGATAATAVLSGYTGVDTAAPIAAEGTFETGTGTQSTASVTPAVSPTTIVGVVSTTDGATAFTPTAVPAFTEAGTINDGADTASFMEYYAATATGTYTSEPTWTGSVRWGAVAVAIQGASPLSVSVAPTTELMDLGQTATLTATGNGGTGTLTYTWSVVSGSCPGFTDSGAATLSYTPGATTTNCVLTVTVQDTPGDTAQPTTPAAVTVNTQLATPATPTPSAVALDVNQAETVTGTIPTTGTPTYAWTWLVSVNSGAYATETHCAVNTGTGAAAGATENCAIAASVLTVGDSYTFELKVTDSATTAESQTSAASATVTVSSALAPPAAPTVSATALDVNQALTVSATIPSTGTPSYSWEWLESVDGGGFGAATVCVTNSGTGASSGSGETCSVAANTLTAGDTYGFELKVTDSASTPESGTSSASSTVTVSSALTAPAAPTVSATSLDENQALTVSGSIPSTGTASYSWQWLVSVDGGAFGDATQCTTNSGTGAAADADETCSIPGDTLVASDTYTFELEVTDSASAPESTTSAPSASVAVSSALSGGTPGPAGVVLDDGQTLLLTAHPSGGGGGYSFQWYSGSSASACTALGSPIVGATASTYDASPSTSTYFCYVVEDADDSLATSATVFVTVNSALTAPSVPGVSATALDVDQPLTVSATLPSTGTGPYGWQWLESVNGAGYASATVCAIASGSAAAGGSLETCSIAASTLTTGDSYSFELQATDSATTPETVVSSASSSVAVNSALTAPSAPAISASALDADQAEAATATIPLTGTAPYSWQWTVSVDGAAAVNATMCATNAGTGATAGATETCSIAGGTLTAGARYSFELWVTDSSHAGPESQLSNPSTTISVTSPLAVPPVPTLSNSTVTLAQSLTVSSTLPSSGTPGYSWQWLVSVNGGAYASATMCGSSASGSGGAAGSAVRCTVPSGSLAPGSSYTFKLEVTDSASVGESTTSGSSAAVAVALPAIGVGTSQGPVGAAYTVSGSGFSASSTVTVEFGTAVLTPTACSIGSFSGTEITTDSSGRFDCTFTVPSSGPGPYSISGTDHASSTTTEAFSFLVTAPVITVSPTQGPSGGTVTVNGDGFSVSSPLASLVFDSVAVTTCITGSLTTNGDGAFSCTFTVPNGVSGSTVRATDVGGSSASTTYTLVASSAAPSGLGGWLWVIVGAVAVLAVLLVVLGVRRRRSSRDADRPAAPSSGPSPSFPETGSPIAPATEPVAGATASDAIGPSSSLDRTAEAVGPAEAAVNSLTAAPPNEVGPSITEGEPVEAAPSLQEGAPETPAEPVPEVVAAPVIVAEAPWSASEPATEAGQPVPLESPPVESKPETDVRPLAIPLAMEEAPLPSSESLAPPAMEIPEAPAAPPAEPTPAEPPSEIKPADASPPEATTAGVADVAPEPRPEPTLSPSPATMPEVSAQPVPASPPLVGEPPLTGPAPPDSTPQAIPLPSPPSEAVPTEPTTDTAGERSPREPRVTESEPVVEPTPVPLVDTVTPPKESEPDFEQAGSPPAATDVLAVKDPDIDFWLSQFKPGPFPPAEPVAPVTSPAPTSPPETPEDDTEPTAEMRGSTPTPRPGTTEGVPEEPREPTAAPPPEPAPSSPVSELVAHPLAAARLLSLFAKIPESQPRPTPAVAPTSKPEPAQPPSAPAPSEPLAPEVSEPTPVPPSPSDETSVPFGAFLWDADDVKEPEPGSLPRRTETKPSGDASDSSDGSAN